MVEPIDKTKTCATCKHCVRGALRRFRCAALPQNPGNYWDGHPEQHWCTVYWEDANSSKSKVEPVKK